MNEDLTGSEQFMLIMTGIAAAGACIAALLQFILRSRCETIKCCGVECIRNVVPSEQATTLNTNGLTNISSL